MFYICRKFAIFTPVEFIFCDCSIIPILFLRFCILTLSTKQYKTERKHTMENKTIEFKSIREVAKLGIFSEYTLRTLIKEEKIPYIKAGNKYFINYTALLVQLDGMKTTAKGEL